MTTAPATIRAAAEDAIAHDDDYPTFAPSDVLPLLDRIAELTGPDMADRLALAAWQHDYPGRTLALPGARELYRRHYAPLGDALVAVLRATAERTNP